MKRAGSDSERPTRPRSALPQTRDEIHAIAEAVASKLRRGDPAALKKAHAAACLDMSVDFFDEHVAPDLRMVRRGGLRLVPVKELDRWLDENAEYALEPKR